MASVPIKSTIDFKFESPTINGDPLDLTLPGTTLSLILMRVSTSVETELAATVVGAIGQVTTTVSQFTIREQWKRRWRYQRGSVDVRSKDWIQFVAK